MRYSWDPTKAATNLRKHGVGFADVIPALEDPNRLERIDERFAYGEERLQTIGLSPLGIVFVVTVEFTGDLCRIVSARRATREERERYLERDHDSW